MMNMLNKILLEKEMEISALYARCLETSNRINWNLEDQHICGRVFDRSQGFLEIK